MNDRETELAGKIVDYAVERIKDEELTMGETLILLSMLKVQIAAIMEMLLISKDKRLMEMPLEQIP